MRVFCSQNVFDYHRQSIYDVISHQYIDWERPGGGRGLPSPGGPGAQPAANRDPAIGRDTLIDLLGDGQVAASLIGAVRFHSANSVPTVGTYLFEFNQPTRSEVYPRWATGAPHDELAYVFGAPLTSPDYQVDPFPAVGFTRADRAMSEMVVRYWMNFVRTG